MLKRNMLPRLKIVFDTNVYVSAAIKPSGPSEALLQVAGEEKRAFDLYISPAILAEVSEKLADSKLANGSSRMEALLVIIQEVTVLVTPTKKLQVVASDPDDDMLFECAVAAGAQLIVTADKAVLSQNPYRAIGVCHPRDLRTIFPADL